ncbi:MAG: hypothetical protein M3281_08930 [Chloroflexota bacterium]|nr:hypothetical protein [Chloroflexota bacterium]
MGFLKKLFGGEPSATDEGLYFYVRCGQCGEAIRIRVNPSADLSPLFEGEGDDPTGYELRKEILGNRCFRMIEATWQFDSRRNVVGSSIQGGREISADEYEAEAAARSQSS